MKNVFIAALLLLAFTASYRVFAETVVGKAVTSVTSVSTNIGTVQFNASLVNAPCPVDISADGQAVELGQYRITDFKATGDVSATGGFNIGFNGCTADTYSKASVTFSGRTIVGNNKTLVVDGGADGVGIQILQNNTALPMDGSVAYAATNLIESSNNLAFKTQYIALSDRVTPGPASAMANFTINYQ